VEHDTPDKKHMEIHSAAELPGIMTFQPHLHLRKTSRSCVQQRSCRYGFSLLWYAPSMPCTSHQVTSNFHRNHIPQELLYIWPLSWRAVPSRLFSCPQFTAWSAMTEARPFCRPGINGKRPDTDSLMYV